MFHERFTSSFTGRVMLASSTLYSIYMYNSVIYIYYIYIYIIYVYIYIYCLGETHHLSLHAAPSVDIGWYQDLYKVQIAAILPGRNWMKLFELRVTVHMILLSFHGVSIQFFSFYYFYSISPLGSFPVTALLGNSSRAISPSSEPSSRAKTTRAGPKYPAACTAWADVGVAMAGG